MRSHEEIYFCPNSINHKHFIHFFVFTFLPEPIHAQLKATDSLIQQLVAKETVGTHGVVL